MNNLNQQDRSESFVRYFAIIGFVVLVFVLAYLAVQVVRLIPVAFTSLANVFEANQRSLQDRVKDKEEDNVVIVKEDDSEDVDDIEEVIETPSTPTTDISTSTKVVKPAPAKPVAPVEYKTVVTYKTPVSDPRGYTDFETTFVSVGQMTSANKFVASDKIISGETNAMQFKVKNIGTKTSTDWSFVAELPSGSSMISKTQSPLKPSETTTLTIVFDVDRRDNSRYIGATAVGGGDANLTNNGFRTTVSIK